MTIERVKEWLQASSFRELTLVLDLLITGWIIYFYLGQLLQASEVELGSPDWLSALLLEVIIYSVLLTIASEVFLALVGDKGSERPMDVREKQINLVGYKYSSRILQFGIGLAIVQYYLEVQGWTPDARLIPFLPLHIMLLVFLLAEAARYGAQLYKGRSGDIYD
jgi:hypothetical protein